MKTYISKPRSYLRFTVGLVLCSLAVYYAIDKDFSPLYLLAGTAATLVLLDLAFYQETVVEVDGMKLKARV